MAEIRAASEKHECIKAEWGDVVEPVKILLSERFSKLALKDKPACSLHISGIYEFPHIFQMTLDNICI